MIVATLVLAGAVSRTPAAVLRTPAPSPSPAVTPPALVSRAMPDPTILGEKCRGKKYLGTPILEASIGSDGRVQNARVTRSCGCPAGDQLLVDTVKTWKYQPAMSNGKPVASFLTLTVNHYWW